MQMNLPNKLSVVRILLVPLIVMALERARLIPLKEK